MFIKKWVKPKSTYRSTICHGGKKVFWWLGRGTACNPPREKQVKTCLILAQGDTVQRLKGLTQGCVMSKAGNCKNIKHNAWGWWGEF